MNLQEYKKIFEKFECKYCLRIFNGFGCEKHYINYYHHYYYFVYNERQYIVYYYSNIELVIKISKEKSVHACENNIDFDFLCKINIENINVSSLFDLQNIVCKYIDNLIFQ